jgi:hypothetical protein
MVHSFLGISHEFGERDSDSKPCWEAAPIGGVTNKRNRKGHRTGRRTEKIITWFWADVNCRFGLLTLLTDGLQLYIKYILHFVLDLVSGEALDACLACGLE